MCIRDSYVDWLWFGEVGFRSVFWTSFWWQVLVGVAAFAIFFVIVEFNVELARRLAPGFRVTAAGDLLEPRSEALRKWVGFGGLGVSLLVAVIAGVGASAQWQTLRRGADAGDDGDQEAHAQTAEPYPLAQRFAARLEQVARGGDAEAGRQTAGELDVELDDDKEDGERRDAD